MARSVDYLNKAVRVNYFTADEEDEFGWQLLLEGIQETIKSNFPEFDSVSRWDGRETRIILEGYGVEVGLSEYCGLCSLSVRVDESSLRYCETDEEYNEEYRKAVKWVEDNWAEASKYWNEYRKVGTFSNGEGVYEKINLDISK